ncbi:hypothetical protein CONPUDRAFT_162025 [Coniophora puteana RWD-64-598 SS2]|uniref:Transmembrane protein n=1 Tax=Coniophora puteana (strain RWD-64-598) TaxID=741705 RepID=A0A5M3MZU0_CONPW|nr:uncharacterized protein CONPUDRAFT_162025 [Coniophora puteana RWD-64-598 SS2]EIW84648.1 hypothetical protein CONPUDRAFT_162025 [Coniophora puteana RWD-64-598 SS2]
MPYVSRWAGAAAIAVGLGRMARSQSTNVTCPTSLWWANNTMGQNPCLMAAYAYEPCSGNVDVTTLASGTVYSGAGNQTSLEGCLCNTVTYSLFAACATCQNVAAQDWATWSGGCSGSTIGQLQYPPGVPSGTVFPPWAYLPIVNNGWDESIAQTNASLVAVAMSTSAAISSSSIASVSATSVAASLSNAAIASSLSVLQASQTAGSSSSHSHTGAIAGGVVGGVVGLALVAGAVFVFLRRRRNKQSGVSGAYADPSNSQPEMYQSGMNRQTKFYNPDDPTTYPTSPHADSDTQHSPGHHLPGPYQQTTHEDQSSGYHPSTTYSGTLAQGYSGAPEV